MPVLVAEEWITAPLKVVRKLHEESAAASRDGAEQRVVEHFTELLQSEEAWTKVAIYPPASSCRYLQDWAGLVLPAFDRFRV
jgi:hypothetical protein